MSTTATNINAAIKPCYYLKKFISLEIRNIKLIKFISGTTLLSLVTNLIILLTSVTGDQGSRIQIYIYKANSHTFTHTHSHTYSHTHTHTHTQTYSLT